jgi:RNA recognition motif-containing protein
MNIFISNLNFSVNDEDLHGLFEAFGEVTSSKVITDKMTGRSRGFGFVEMSDDAEGKQAIEKLNGTEFKGRELNVSVARPREDSGNRNSNFDRRRRDY